MEEHGIDPSPARKGKTSWPDFIKAHTDSLLATEFLTTEVWTPLGLITFYVLFFIHVGSRKIYLGGITRNPTDDWMRQAARNLTSNSCDLLAKCRYLIRDRDAKFTAAFDMILRSAGVEPIPLPPRRPNLNAFAERFIRFPTLPSWDQHIANNRWAFVVTISHSSRQPIYVKAAIANTYFHGPENGIVIPNNSIIVPECEC